MEKGLSPTQQKVVDLLSHNVQPYGLVGISMNTLKALVRKGVIREKRNSHFRHPIYELIKRSETA